MINITNACLQGGGYLLDLLDFYAAGWPYLFIGFCELIIVSYVYGIQNFLDDLYQMCKFNPGLVGKTNFMFIYMTLAPLIIGVRRRDCVNNPLQF